jgi:hypothetical protein
VTICIPSNRKLAQSRQSIDAAISYATERGFRVVVSDNSRDPEKAAYYAAGPAHMRYISSAPAHPTDNVISSLDPVGDGFVLMLGDDDVISSTGQSDPVDFAALPSAVIGVKPKIEIWSQCSGVTAINDFEIDESQPVNRVFEYASKSRGGNSTYYSFFRARPFKDAYLSFARHHPARIGNGDWSLIYAMVAEGRIVFDPSTCLRYDNARWEDPDKSFMVMKTLFADAGLGPEALRYMLLFHFMDSYVLILRAGSTLPLMERCKSAYAAGLVFLKKFMKRVSQYPADFAPAMDRLFPLRAAIESDDPDLEGIFEAAGLVADRVKPGLKKAYDQFLLAAVEAPALR